MKPVNIWTAILDEREHQRELWDRDHDWGHGDCSSEHVEDIVKAAVLTEECGEVTAAVLDREDAEHLPTRTRPDRGRLRRLAGGAMTHPHVHRWREVWRDIWGGHRVYKCFVCGQIGYGA